MQTRIIKILLGTLILLLGVNLTQALTRSDSLPPSPAVPSLPPSVPLPPLPPLPPLADADGEVMIDRTFTVAPDGLLDVRVEHADVQVTTGQGRDARVRVLLAARDRERARRYFDELRFEVEQQDHTVSVSTNRQGSWNWSGARNGGARITVLVTVPEHFNADVHLAHGDLELPDLNGTVAVQTAHGDVSAGRLEGASHTFQTAHGDLSIARLHSRMVELEAAHGDVSIREVISGSFDAQTAHGDLRIEAMEGRFDVSSAHGDVRVHFTKAAGFDIRNAHGDIDLSAPANTPGDVHFEASDVNIASAYRFVGTIKDEQATGRINGGGPAMQARTSHGSISLRSR